MAHADIYKTIDANGNVTYSDKPINQDSTQISIPKTNSSPASAATSTPAPENNSGTTAPVVGTDANKNTKQAYTTFSFASPLDQDSIQNQPILNVKMNVQPSLQEGDLIQVNVDGAAMEAPKHQTSFDFTIPYRGTHTLSATLFDKDMQVLKKSNSITIYVHQAHLGSPAS